MNFSIVKAGIPFEMHNAIYFSTNFQDHDSVCIHWLEHFMNCSGRTNWNDFGCMHAIALSDHLASNFHQRQHDNLSAKQDCFIMPTWLQDWYGSHGDQGRNDQDEVLCIFKHGDESGLRPLQPRLNIV
jgi:hypothetical protein